MDEITFEAGSTTTVTSWSVDGALGALVELKSSVQGSPFYLVASGGPFTSDYVIISDSQASVDASWTAGANSADFGGNSGWWDAASPVCTDRIYFTPGETYNISSWSVDGAPGANILLASYPPSAAHYLVATAGPFTSDYLNILWSDASPDADWTALENCFDAGNNRAGGWFTYENTFGVVLWLEAWAPTAGVTTDSPSAIVALESGSTATAVNADTPTTELWLSQTWLELGLGTVFSVVMWMDVWATTAEVYADAQAVEATMEPATTPAGVTTDSGGAEVAVGLQAPSTHVPGDAGGAGVVVESQGAAGAAQGYVQAAEATIEGAWVTAGVTTDSGGAEVAVTLQSPSTSVSGDAGGAGAVVEAGGAAGSAQGYAQAAVVDVGGVGVGAGVFAPASGAIIALEAAHRVWQHFARPPVVHQTIPRSMGERVISRVTLQATIAYPRLEMGVSRWRT